MEGGGILAVDLERSRQFLLDVMQCLKRLHSNEIKNTSTVFLRGMGTIASSFLTVNLNCLTNT